MCEKTRNSGKVEDIFAKSVWRIRKVGDKGLLARVYEKCKILEVQGLNYKCIEKCEKLKITGWISNKLKNIWKYEKFGFICKSYKKCETMKTWGFICKIIEQRGKKIRGSNCIDL